MRQGHPLVVDGQLMGFAKGVVAEGRFAFLSGVTGRGASMGDQAESCWATIKERLESLGGRLENVVQRMTSRWRSVTSSSRACGRPSASRGRASPAACLAGGELPRHDRKPARRDAHRLLGARPARVQGRDPGDRRPRLTA